MFEKFSIKWNDCQANWTKALTELRDDDEFADVTLISDDKVKFVAHKILLTSCSNLFKYILKGTTHPYPLVYLSGVSSVNLSFILDYIYHGEVNLFQEQLDCFLESAKKLEIEGLLSDQLISEYQDQTNKFMKDQDQKNKCKKDQDQKNKFIKDEQEFQPTENKRRVTNDPLEEKKYIRSITRVHNVASMSPQDIDIKMRELYQKNDGVWSCLACDYSTRTNTGNMRKHIETHLEGLSYTCSSCNKEFRSSNSLYSHKKKCNV